MTDRPTVSVVVPVYNDPEGIRMTLESLVAQTYPDEAYEVIAVDNGSTDGTQGVIREFETAHDTVELAVEDEIQGSYAARNAGIDRATGSVVGFLDADVTVDEEWLSLAVTEMERTDAAYLACDVRLYADGTESPVTRYKRLTGFPVEKYVEEFSFAPTCCLLVRRRLLDDVGRFDERLVSGGDLEFGNRVSDAGRELHFTDEVTAFHPTRSTVREVARKAVRVGRGRYQLRAYYPERYGSPMAMLLNPLTYAPPLPWRLSAAFEDYDSLATREKPLMYLLLTVAKFARTYGKLAQAADIGLDPVRGGSAGNDRPSSEGVAAGADRRNDS